MISEFVEIIFKIYKVLNDNCSPEKALEIINRENAYNRKVIAAAYSWIFDKSIKDILTRKAAENSSSGHRFPSDYEINIIGQDNLDYLAHFHNWGMISNQELESIIDNLILMQSGKINRYVIDGMIFALFLDMHNYVLPGSRLLIFSSDKIN